MSFYLMTIDIFSLLRNILRDEFKIRLALYCKGLLLVEYIRGVHSVFYGICIIALLSLNDFHKNQSTLVFGGLFLLEYAKSKN